MKNKIVILTAPSGAGKTTILKKLLNIIPNSKLVPSTTTRPKRTNENNSDYNFISINDFKSKIENNKFIEWEEVYNNTFYGTLKIDLEKNGIIFLIKDVIGALKLKKYFGDKCITIFIKPPSLNILEERIINRNTDNNNIIQERLNKAIFEMEYEKDFDFSVTNDELEDCVYVIENLILYDFF